MVAPAKINETWPMDFMHDQLDDERSAQLFNVIDAYNHDRPSMSRGGITQKKEACRVGSIFRILNFFGINMVFLASIEKYALY